MQKSELIKGTELNGNESEISDRLKKELDEQLVRKRRDVVLALSGGKRLSQKELAERAATSPASLANISLWFEKFPYRLIEKEVIGKHCYYYLTALGNAYANKAFEEEKDYQSEKAMRQEFEQNLKEAKENLVKFQRMNEEEWKWKLDDALLERLSYCGVLLGEGEDLIDAFIENIEKVILYGGDTAYEKILALVSGDEIIQKRVEIFLEKFSYLSVLLKKLEYPECILQVHEMLEAVIAKRWNEGRSLAAEIGLKDDYEKIEKVVCEIAGAADDRSIQDIYRCFCRYLAGNKMLSAFLANIIQIRKVKNFPE